MYHLAGRNHPSTDITEKNRGDSEEKTLDTGKKKRMTKVEKREARIKAAEKKRWHPCRNEIYLALHREESSQKIQEDIQ